MQQASVNIHPGKKVTSLCHVKGEPNRETIETLTTLLAMANAGEINGIAFAASLKNLRYITDTVGFCHEHPTFARGMVALLSDEIGAFVRAWDETGIR